MPAADAIAVNHMSWKPRIGSAACLLIAAIFSVWLMSPLLWGSILNDGRAFYAAGQVAARGGDVYNQVLIVSEEDRLNDAARAVGSGRDSFTPNPYHYPPVMTRAFQALTPLDEGRFLVVVDAVLLAAGIIGLELVLAALAWRGRWWPRAVFLTSLPMFMVLFTGNPSSLLLLGWGAAFLAYRRNHLLLAGALLAVGLLKIPVGLPVAAALVLAAERGRARMLAGSAIGVGVFAAISLLADPSGSVAWAASLFAFAPTIDLHQTDVMRQCCMSGISALFLGLGPLWASLIAVVLVAGPLLWMFRSGVLGEAWRRQPLVVMALLLAAGLALAPYSHTNDLVLDAMPMLVLASLPLTMVSRVTFVVWSLSVPMRLAFLLTVHQLNVPVGQPWSEGVVLAIATFAAVALATTRLGAAAVRVPERAAASHTRA